MLPSKEVSDLCACPVDWESIDGFGDECPDALELLLYEWVRTVARVSVSSEELHLIEDVLFDPECYEPPHDSVLINLRERRPEAVNLYAEGIGRLGRLQFLRPSEHSKHFAVGGPKSRGQKISYFYNDWQSSTLANLFWSWFDDMMAVGDVPLREGPIQFLRNVAPVWDQFCHGRKIRIAIDTSAAIGELNGVALDHLAIDLDLASAVVHGYPITAAEAQSIMDPFEVRLIKSREY